MILLLLLISADLRRALRHIIYGVPAVRSHIPGIQAIIITPREISAPSLFWICGLLSVSSASLAEQFSLLVRSTLQKEIYPPYPEVPATVLPGVQSRLTAPFALAERIIVPSTFCEMIGRSLPVLAEAALPHPFPPRPSPLINRGRQVRVDTSFMLSHYFAGFSLKISSAVNPSLAYSTYSYTPYTERTMDGPGVESYYLLTYLPTYIVCTHYEVVCKLATNHLALQKINKNKNKKFADIFDPP
jgi:hypothetical protein